MSSDRPNQRNEVDSTAAKNEVQALMKDGITELSPDIISRLRSKYPDENVIDSITEFFIERKKKINKVANIFMDAFQRKYTNDFNGMSMSKFMKKALKYKTTYNLSNDEFDEIKRVFERRLYNSPNGSTVVDKWLPDTNISRVLGHPVVETMDGIKPANTDDYSYLQEIIKLYQLFRSLHSYVVLQSMSYNEILTSNPETINGIYDTKRHNKYIHVHPVIAALFLPKIKELEERMLYASIANIVNIRYNRQQILTKPDFELFYAMVVDPADAVCDNISPLRDLKNRTEVQIQLWNNVFNLRSGRAYEATSIEFMSTLDKCKVSNMDHPDLVYLSDEGVILRRLFSIFSFRPIIMQSSSIMTAISTNPLAIPPNIVSITAVPYIVLRLPLIPSGTARMQGLPGTVASMDPNDQPDLEKALGQIQFTMENGIFVPKMMNIFSINGPLIFYVPRKYNTLPLSINTSISYMMPSQYKNSMINYQQLITTPVEVNHSIDIQEYGTTNTSQSKSKFILKSVVMYEQLDTNVVPTTIMGHKTLIFNTSDDTKMHQYAPLMHIRQDKGYLYENENDEKYKTTGTIFVYIKNGDSNQDMDGQLTPAASNNVKLHDNTALFQDIEKLIQDNKLLFTEKYDFNKLVDLLIIVMMLSGKNVDSKRLLNLFDLYVLLMIKISFEIEINNNNKDVYNKLFSIFRALERKVKDTTALGNALNHAEALGNALDHADALVNADTIEQITETLKEECATALESAVALGTELTNAVATTRSSAVALSSARALSSATAIESALESATALAVALNKVLASASTSADADALVLADTISSEIEVVLNRALVSAIEIARLSKVETVLKLKEADKLAFTLGTVLSNYKQIKFVTNIKLAQQRINNGVYKSISDILSKYFSKNNIASILHPALVLQVIKDSPFNYLIK